MFGFLIRYCLINCIGLILKQNRVSAIKDENGLGRWIHYSAVFLSLSFDFQRKRSVANSDIGKYSRHPV